MEGLNRTGAAGCPVVYIRGHPRAPGEVNGKSGNLNNALSNVLYPGGMDPGSHEASSRHCFSSSACRTPGACTSCCPAHHTGSGMDSGLLTSVLPCFVPYVYGSSTRACQKLHPAPGGIYIQC